MSDEAENKDVEASTTNSTGGRFDLDKEWLPDEAFEAAKLEKILHEEEDESSTTRRLFRESATVAALSIIHIARHDPNGRTRLAAAQYVVDRAIGRIADEQGSAEKSPLDAFLNEVGRYANDGSGN